MAEEKAKRKVATKRQEELELRKKQEEAARQKKLQQVVSQHQHSKWRVHVERSFASLMMGPLYNIIFLFIIIYTTAYRFDHFNAYFLNKFICY